MDNKNVYEVDYSENEKKGRLLSLISIFINIVSVIVAFIGLFSGEKAPTYILFFLACIWPIVGFVYSFYLRRRFFHKLSVLWLITFIINIVIYVGYVFVIFIIAFLAQLVYRPVFY